MESNHQIQYVKGKHNHIAGSSSGPVVVTYNAPEAALLEKTREEIRALQLAEARCGEMIEYLEGGKVPHGNKLSLQYSRPICNARTITVF